MPEYPSLVTEVYKHASVGISGPLTKGDLIMSRAKKGVASEGKGASLQEESGSDSKVEFMMAKFMANIKEKFQQMDTRFDEKLSGLDKRLEERLTRLEKTRSDGHAGVLEETSTQRHGASKDGVTQKTPQTGTRMLQGKRKLSTGHHEEEQDQVPASRPVYRAEK